MIALLLFRNAWANNASRKRNSEKGSEMKSYQPKHFGSNRLAGAFRLKLALVTIGVMLFVTLPQMLGARARAAANPSQGASFTVNTTDDHDDGACNAADCTLREAIQAANTAPTEDTIGFNVAGTIDLLTALPDITDSVAIAGPGAELLTIHPAPTKGFRIFTVTAPGAVTLSGMTISGGRVGSGTGAGIYNDTGTLYILNTTVTSNAAVDSSGGGISNNSGTVFITDSIINNNSTDSNGGGIFNFEGKVTVANSTISENRADDDGGGGITNAGGTLTVIGSTITENSTEDGDGGGVANGNGVLNITNSTISLNQASDGSGGGIKNSSTGSVNLTNSTVSSNRARLAGGGVLNRDGGTFQVRSSIIALNGADFSGPDASGTFTSTGFNLIGKSDASTGFAHSTDLTGTTAAPRDPGLDPNGLQDNGGPTKTIALLCGSPAIDKGTNDGLTGNLFTDQRGEGFPRAVDDPLVPNPSNGTDIGAFELPVCNHPPVAQCKNIQVSAGANCQATITAAQIDNGSFDPDAGDSIAARALDSSGPFALGPHNVTLTVTDTHGSSSSCMATVTVVDTTPPVITCPPNITAKPNALNDPCVVVNFATPVATDNCSVMSVSCIPPSGSCFPLGSTTVTCTAKDGSGNSATCSFVVTVFNVCLQDDSTASVVFLGNSQTGAYRLCCGGTVFSGIAQVIRRGSTVTFQHYPADRRLQASADEATFRGSASLQYPPGVAYCTITDRDTRNNGCVCQ